MGTITKDSMPAETPAAGAVPSDPDHQANTRGDAVGAEIPVVVHASRYSTGKPGVAKQLAPVHEQTRTVIVFPQGAVVRLSANLLPGEIVVLTHQRNGHDVICRVESVKAQPGIQNYVSLEFTQRAPGFWDELFPEEHTAGAHLADPPPALPAESGAASPEKTTPPQFPGPALPQEARPVDSAVKPPNRVVPLPEPAKPAAPPPDAVPAAIPGHPGAGAKPRPALQAQKPVRAFAPQLQVPEPASGSRKVLLIAGAIVVLVAAAVGGVVLRREQARASQTSLQANLPQNPAPPEAAVPQPASAPGSDVTANSAPADSTATPPAPEMAIPAAGHAESGRAAKPSRPAAAARRTLSRPHIAIASLPAPILNKHATLTASQPPTVPVASPAGNLLAAVQNSNAPAAPAPVQGGQIQLPKLIESPAPVYPALARAQAVQGTVVIDALVALTGRVAAMKVLSGPSLLRRAAMDALRAWKYQPGRLNGQPVAMHMQVRIDFRLQ